MIIGMDFGTTNSGMAAYDGRQLQIIPISRSGNAIDRTALYITNDRQIYTGRSAIDTYFAQNLNRPVNIQRVRVGEITMTFAELPSFVKDVYIDKDVLSPGRLFLSFKTALSSLNYVGTVVGSHFYFLEDIIALYLLIAKQQAEKYLQGEVKRIVLGRPVRFNFDPQADQLAKERLLKAAFRAGYEEVYLQYEPIAAAYHYESTIDREQHILVFDFGGGTLDISILRVGNPKNRAVLATGGVPIAGDVFDQKLVRAKLPKHFGEGSAYRVGNMLLPVPSSYYEAFSNWQEMLTLQRPDMLEEMKKIEQNAEKPQQIRALRQLVSSSYGIKMFDIVEGGKRELSNAAHTIIKLDGQDFRVRELVTRAEFERVIRSDIRTIETYLDDLIGQAGLTLSEIDVVIRTGGSSQIPVFVNMLEARFGKEKVRSLDVFSSVTSGLGLIAHQIEQGEIEMPVHRPSDFISADHITENTKNGIPVVDFEVMKKFIALTEVSTEEQQSIALVGLTPNKEIITALAPTTSWNATPLDRVIAAPSDQPLLLLTSEYRFLLKTPRQLTRLNALGLELADAEGFQTDIFGDEYVTSITDWSNVQSSHAPILISHSGHFKIFTETLLPRIAQPVPYQVARLKGNPLMLMDTQGEIFLFSASGRTARLQLEKAAQSEGRLMNISVKDTLIAALLVNQPASLLLANNSGMVMRLDSSDIATADAIPTSGARIFPQRDLKSVLIADKNQSIHIVTSQRILPINWENIEAEKPQKLKEDEKLIALVNLHPSTALLPIATNGIQAD